MRRLAALLAVTATSLAAQSTPSAPPRAPNVCPSSTERHQFDFWLGTWDVKTTAGAPAGQSVVQSISGGCAMLENWTSVAGGHGKSINAYNPAIRQWQQYWVGQDGNPVEYRESTFDGTSLIFVARSGATVQRLTFTPLDGGVVRQFGEISQDGGGTWKTSYDLRYHRTGPPPP